MQRVRFREALGVRRVPASLFGNEVVVELFQSGARTPRTLLKRCVRNQIIPNGNKRRLTRWRRRWCGRFLSLYRPDFDRPRQERAVSIFEIGAAYLIVLVKIVDGRGFAAFGYWRALNDFQNARISSALDSEGLRVFVHGGNDSMIRHE